MREFLCVAAIATGFAVALCGQATAQDPDGPTNTIVNPAGDKKAPAVNGWTGEVAPANSPDGITLDAHQTKLVHQVSDYFESLQNLKGSFIQTDADNKRMKGKFFVKRPGRFRFDYSLPSKQIIVSDGENLAIQDLD